jgi:general secretion pathway protein D
MKWSARLLFYLMLTASFCPPPVDAAGSDSRKPAEDRRISINLSNVDIAVFIEFFSELTGRNFVVDPRVKGNVTILSSSRISMSDLEAVFQSTLAVNGFSTVDAGQVTKIVPSAEARTMGVKTDSPQDDRPAADVPITQIIPLTRADAAELKRLLTPMISRSAFIAAYTDANVLLITDTAANIRRMLKIIRELDVEDTGRELTLIPLEYSDGNKLANILTGMFQPSTAVKKRQGRAKISITADERTNMLVIIADKENTRRIKNLTELLDKKVQRERGKIRIYAINNAEVEELIKTLGELPIEGGSQDTTKGRAPVLPPSLKISSDTATNSLIVTAENEAELQQLEGIIQALDVPRVMVYIEALIMEVDARENLRFGVEWTAVGETQIGGKAAAVGGGFVNQSGQSALPGLASGIGPTGFSLGVFTEAIDIAGVQFNNLAALIQAFKDNQNVNIVSTPQLLTTDNEEAKITVATNLPFQSGTSTFQDDTFATFEYRDVGTTLSVTPQIGAEGTVRLTISLELSALESTTDFKPTTLKRMVDTDVVIQDTNTVVIGGLIEDNRTLSEFKVPLLGDIPLLGWLFKFQGEAQQRKNLFIFLTPRVVQNSADASGLRGRKRDILEKMKTEHNEKSAVPLKDHEQIQP